MPIDFQYVKNRQKKLHKSVDVIAAGNIDSL